MNDYRIEKIPSKNRDKKQAIKHLRFGRYFTDHMFIMDYTDGKGWNNPRIVQYQPISLDPACSVFHYNQSVFEGLKAYWSKDEQIFLFRPERNFKRLNQSSNRLCIPQIDEKLALEALKELIMIDKDCVPKAEGASLYIRPFIISTSSHLGAAPSESYQFIIILSPVCSCNREGGLPLVKIAVEQEYVKAVRGGTGEAKTGANYASSLKGQERAEKLGYSQALWLDGKKNKYIEEVGNMNIFFKINGEVVTPALNGSILEGVTRDSVIHLLKYWNITVVERRISIDEIYKSYRDGYLEEAFGTGTASVISAVGELLWEDKKLIVNNGVIGNLAKKLYNTLTGIQNGTCSDPFGWRLLLEESIEIKSFSR